MGSAHPTYLGPLGPRVPLVACPPVVFGANKRALGKGTRLVTRPHFDGTMLRMDVIHVDGLAKRYGRRVGVHDLSFQIQSGALFGFLGPNGAGKTSTIRMLLGLLRPSSGRATIFGLDVWEQSHRIKADVGYVPGDLRLYPWLTCRNAAAIVGRARGMDLTARGRELSDEFHLDPDVPVQSMSRGMKQKLGLMLALIHTPRLLILDEPSTGLDPLMQEILFAHLRRRVAEGGTVFFSSHTLSEVELLCDRVAILRDGRMVEHETLQRLRDRAGRTVEILWKPDAATDRIEVPPFLRIAERNGVRWRAALTGSRVELMRWCAGQPIADVSIGQPDLAELFRTYYAATEEER